MSRPGTTLLCSLTASLLAIPWLPAFFAPATAAPLPPDSAGIWTVQDENASISTAKITDRYYTNGLRLGYTSAAGALPAGLEEVGRQLWGDGQRRWSIDITQHMYTPFNTSTTTLVPGDRPYAGILMGTFGLQSDTETHRSVISVGLGVIGPAALGEEVQNGFHTLISQRQNKGWASQLQNEPVVQVTSSRVWRVKTGQIAGMETEALPELTVGAGSMRVYALTGVTLRIGQGLDADFGVARVRPGPSGGDAFRQTRDFGWYVFMGAHAQGVAHDITLDGTIFRNGPTVKRTPFVGEAQGGVALLIYGARLTYTHVVQSEQFKRQKGGLHQFGSLALSMRF